MTNHLKYTFSFTEVNFRLNERKNRSKTLSLPRELFDHYDVDGMLRAFNYEANNIVHRDSAVTVRSIKVGRTQFQV